MILQSIAQNKLFLDASPYYFPTFAIELNIKERVP